MEGGGMRAQVHEADYSDAGGDGEGEGGVPDFARFLEEEGAAAASELREEENERRQQREMAAAVLEMMDLEADRVDLPENPDRMLRFQGGFVRGAVVHRDAVRMESAEGDADATAVLGKPSARPGPGGPASAKNSRRKSFLSSTKEYLKRKGATMGKALGASNEEDGIISEEMLVHARTVRDFVNAVTTGKIQDKVDHMLQAFIFDDYLVLARMRNTTGRLAVVATFELLDVSVRDMASSHFVFEDEVLREEESDEDDDEDDDNDGNEDDRTDGNGGNDDASSAGRLKRKGESSGMESIKGSQSGDDGSRSGHRSLRSRGSGTDRLSSKNQSVSGESSAPSSASVRASMLEILCSSSGTRLALDAGGEPHKQMWIEQIVSSVKDAVRRERPVRASGRGWEHGIRRGTIWSAALEGHSYEVGRILAKRPEQACVCDGNGASPLHLACIGGQVLTAAQLLRAGASASDVDNDLMTPLHYAALKHRANIVPMLLQDDWENGADVDAQDLQSQTPLLLACREIAEDPGKAAAFVEALGGFGPDTEIADVTGDTPLLVAVRRNQGGLVASLLKIGAKTETASLHSGLTPLLAVCASPHPNMSILSKLLLSGANPNAHYANAGANFTSLQLLANTLASAAASEAASAEPADAADKEAERATVGDEVSVEDCRDCIQLLVSYGARVDLENTSQQIEAIGVDVSDAMQHWSTRAEPSGLAAVTAKQTYRIPFAVKSSDFIDSSSCTSCGTGFGMLDKRQHCRRCAHTFCAKCTTKAASMRSLDDQSIATVRVCNACFNALCKTYTMLVHDARALTSAQASAESGAAGAKAVQQPASLGAQPMSEQKPMAQRKTGGAGAKTNAVQETLGQTRDALIERGERLNKLGEASAALSNNAGNFSSMARKLREREEKNAGWFGGLF